MIKTMDIAKIKNSLSKIDLKIVFDKCQNLTAIANKLSQIFDKKALLIGTGIVIFIYSSIFIYVLQSAPSTIKKLESQLATEIVPIQSINKSKPKPKPKSNNITTKPKSAEAALIDGLSETTPMGEIPIIRPSDNLTSFRAYQRPFSFNDVNNKPIVSFILIDYGLSQKQSEYALDILPPEVSFMLSPYSDLPNEWVKMARAKGHEVWINTPVQNEKYTNSGKNTIFHHSSVAQKLKSMKESLVLTSGYVGIGSYTDDSMNIIAGDYLKLMDDIYARGLGYIETNPNAPKIIEKKAFDMFTPYIRADLEIIRMKGNNKSFEKLEMIAKEKGYAVAVIPSYPNAIKNLAVWLLKIAKSDYAVAPISAIYDLPLHKSTGSDNNDNQY